MSKLLILDDDRYFTEDLSDFLQMEGYQVVTINTSDELHPMLGAMATYKAVILDIMMRKGVNISPADARETGEIIWQEIRARHPGLPILVISAKNQDEVDVDFSDANTYFVRKPLSSNIEEVLKIIKNL